MKNFVSENVFPNATRVSQTFDPFDANNTVIHESYDIVIPNDVLASYCTDLANQEAALSVFDPQVATAAIAQDKALLQGVLPPVSEEIES